MSKYVKFPAMVDEKMPPNKLLVDIIYHIDKKSLYKLSRKEKKEC